MTDLAGQKRNNFRLDVLIVFGVGGEYSLVKLLELRVEITVLTAQ